MIDNYDSFTYNLVQYMGELGAEIRVDRNDQISVKEIEKLNPEKIVVSPGPCTPAKAGYRWKWLNILPGRFRFWAFAWDISRWALRLAEKLSKPVA